MLRLAGYTRAIVNLCATGALVIVTIIITIFYIIPRRRIPQVQYCDFRRNQKGHHFTTAERAYFERRGQEEEERR